MSFKVLCGVPSEFCSGGNYVVSSGLGRSRKVHKDHEEAFKCHSNFLISQGFKKIGIKEFIDPKDNTIRILTRKSKFGGKLRKGKEGSRAMPSNTNNIARKHDGGSISSL